MPLDENCEWPHDEKCEMSLKAVTSNCMYKILVRIKNIICGLHESHAKYTRLEIHHSADCVVQSWTRKCRPGHNINFRYNLALAKQLQHAQHTGIKYTEQLQLIQNTLAYFYLLNIWFFGVKQCFSPNPGSATGDCSKHDNTIFCYLLYQT